MVVVDSVGLWNSCFYKGMEPSFHVIRCSVV